MQIQGNISNKVKASCEFLQGKAIEEQGSPGRNQGSTLLPFACMLDSSVYHCPNYE